MISILVVEDDKHTRKLMETILKRQGYSIFVAEDGVQGMEVLDNHHIDLIILDVMMPNMDGFEFAKELREGECMIPILMVTAKQLQEDKIKGFVSGADDYMTKPIDTEEMLLRIKALLRRSQIFLSKKNPQHQEFLQFRSLFAPKNTLRYLHNGDSRHPPHMGNFSEGSS